MSDEEMKYFRKYSKRIKLFKNNSAVIKKSSDLLKQASLNLDEIINMYEHPLDYIGKNENERIHILFENFNKCLELSAQGINNLSIYNDIQMASIEMDDTKEEE